MSEDWYFLSHRVQLALEAVKSGFEVAVATRLGERAGELRALPFLVFDLDMHRGSLAPHGLLGSTQSLREIVGRWRPDVVNCVALGTAVVTALALRPLGATRLVVTIAGLGYVFSNEGLKAKLLRLAFGGVLRVLFSGSKVTVVVQNKDDRGILSRFVQEERIRVIPGSGVDVAAFSSLPEPGGPFTVGYTGRLLRDKGVGELVEALRQLRIAGSGVRALVAGRTDPGNPSSFDGETVRSWVAEGLIEWLGEVRDVRDVWEEAHVAVLPSYREGMPKALLEAAACGRALIATDVPGCRAIVRHGETGLLVPVRRSRELAAAIDEMRLNAPARREMGLRGRELVEREMAATIVNEQFLSLFREVMAQLDGTGRGPDGRLVKMCAPTVSRGHS